MKNFVGFTLGCLFAFLSSGITPLMAQDAAVNELVITGTVKNKDSRKKLENVNVSVVGNNIGTVTNADGTFSLKVAEAEAFRGLEVSHIGYLTTHLSLEELDGLFHYDAGIIAIDHNLAKKIGGRYHPYGQLARFFKFFHSIGFYLPHRSY